VCSIVFFVYVTRARPVFTKHSWRPKGVSRGGKNQTEKKSVGKTLQELAKMGGIFVRS